MYSNGYEFYYFIRKFLIGTKETDNPKDYNVGGFLRCSSPLMPSKHYLPVCFTIEIPLHTTGQSALRKFAPSRVVFQSSQSAIGGNLTIGKETWADVADGTCAIVVDNTISVNVTIEFLDDDNGCQLLL